jgi:4-hydroxy-tetrahydrodipicolinate synthase
MKAVMDLVGVDAPELLAPLVPPDPELAARLRAELARQLALFEPPVAHAAG